MPADLTARLNLLRAAEPGPRRARPSAPDIDSVVAGRYRELADGACFVAERRYALGHQHGAWHLAAGLALPPAARRALGRAAGGADLDPRTALFLDTETTGLSGGTGTYAFLVGVGYLEADEFVVEQYFMRHPGEEPALLEAVGRLLVRFPLWVTFNGRGFDIPLLATRFQCVRRHTLAPAPQHLDLLGVARRLWRQRLPSCALGSLERAVLGVTRGDDVPSWLIPTLYFDYVRRQHVAPLHGVFAHNAVDILSMVGLLAEIGATFAEPARHAPRVDPVGVARLLVQAGEAAAATAWCRDALPALEAAEHGRLRWELATLLRRAGARAEAVEHWQQLAGRPGPWAALAFEALAKHYEHHARDLDAARRATEAALTALTLFPEAGSAARREQLERRLGRLFFRARLGTAGKANGTSTTRWLALGELA
jgi:hypothetical protein